MTSSGEPWVKHALDNFSLKDIVWCFLRCLSLKSSTVLIEKCMTPFFKTTQRYELTVFNREVQKLAS